jgi:deoxyribodipyrimidine photo-lyase
LRLTDNNCLFKIASMPEIKEILPVFIYDHNQITAPMASEFFLRAQEEALADLDSTLQKNGSRLCKFYGTPYKVVNYLIHAWKPDLVAFNLDYSQYSVQRDTEISKICKAAGVKLVADHDVMLGNVEFNKLFHVFSKAVLQLDVKTVAVGPNKFVKKMFDIEKTNVVEGRNVVPINRSWALNRVREFCKGPEELFKKSGVPATAISAHLKLGLISAREVFNFAMAQSSGYLVKQMVWREFYFSLARSGPKNHYDFYDDRYKFMEWRNDPAETKAMWTGRTGFPLVDASMNELNTTGFMWNRGRLIVGFFSVKILRINPFLAQNTEIHKWHMGGQLYFSKMLIDACYANNTGNWHWVASDTVDASGQRFGKGWSGRPMDVEKFKPAQNSWSLSDAEYVAKWLPKKAEKKKIVSAKDRWAEWVNLTH